jgi:hypothetical protein
LLSKTTQGCVAPEFHRKMEISDVKIFRKSLVETGRDERIRTSDLLTPSHLDFILKSIKMSLICNKYLKIVL